MGLAAEGHQPLETAAGTADPGESAGQDAAVEIGAQVAFDVGWQAPSGRAALARCGEEGLEPAADDGVEEGLLRLAPAVGGKGHAGGAVAPPPGRGAAGALAWSTPAALVRTGPGTAPADRRSPGRPTSGADARSRHRWDADGRRGWNAVRERDRAEREVPPHRPRNGGSLVARTWHGAGPRAAGPTAARPRSTRGQPPPREGYLS